MSISVRRIAAVIAVSATIAAAQVAYAASPAYDGVYRGEMTRTRGDDSICGKASNQSTFTVVNGQFSILYDPSHRVGVNLEVQSDGSFSGSQPYMVGSRRTQLRASGRIANSVLDAQVDGEACSRSYHLTKR